jgi:hypothetical protein
MVWGYVSPQMGLLTAMDLGETSSALRPRLNSSVTRGLETAETLSREAEGGGAVDSYSNDWNNASENMEFLGIIIINHR